MSRDTGWLLLTHMIGNALILWLGYYWLGLSESDGPHLTFSAAVILLFALLALWLHGTALALFNRVENLSFGRAARRSLRHLLPLFVLAMVVAAIYGLLAHWRESFGHSAFVIGSYSTMKIRRPVSPTGVLRVFHGFIWILRWIAVPVLAFPLAANIAIRGWAGFRLESFGRSKRWLYWIEVCALLLCAVWVPFKLLSWIPELSKFPAQMVSLLARLGVGYLLFVAGLLSLEFFSSAGKPALSQASTTPSP